MRKLLAVLALVLLAGGVLAAYRCSSDERRSRPTAIDGSDPSGVSSAWPAAGAVLRPVTVSFRSDVGTKRIFIDAGHGAADNTGNTNAFCEDEQDFTLRLGGWVARWLEETGRFETKLSRRADQQVEYRQRVAEAKAWHAAAFISIHSDVRGRRQSWSPEAGTTCPRTDEAVGFTVLWSDEGPMPLQLGRLALARALAGRLEQTGLPAYDGWDYRGQYQVDSRQPGVFVDRHAPGKRIFVLREPSVPAVIVETHNAWHPTEAERWEQTATREAFATALAAALTDVLR